MTILSKCDENEVTKFKKKHPGETSLSATKEEAVWTIVSGCITWTLNVPAAKQGTCRKIKQAMKRLRKAEKERKFNEC